MPPADLLNSLTLGETTTVHGHNVARAGLWGACAFLVDGAPASLEEAARAVERPASPVEAALSAIVQGPVAVQVLVEPQEQTVLVLGSAAPAPASARRMRTRARHRVAAAAPAPAAPAPEKKTREEKPLPATWEPDSRTRRLIEGRGLKPAEYLAAYHVAMVGQVRKAWTSKDFRDWVSAKARPQVGAESTT